ncbi:hypothetical protein GCM10010324_37630 [Streptomyces hiroshimensis]|uniref:Uncharacterized protein n=1 Tax=Streptomyces hiroshimensis TaxID=66424 RepID=A0ABQ2YN81_9ACTN|nr:hypothetical protein GCM10010324_37630 [Streptomyces hiroshimensis]
MWSGVYGGIRALRDGVRARPVEVGGPGVSGSSGVVRTRVYLTLTALQAAPTVLYSVLVVPYSAPAADSVAVRAAL